MSSKRKCSKNTSKKKEYEEILNDIFETNIKWSRLTQSDLEKLTDILSDSKKTLKILIKLVDFEEIAEELIKRVVKEQIKRREKVKTLFDVIKILKNEFIEKL